MPARWSGKAVRGAQEQREEDWLFLSFFGPFLGNAKKDNAAKRRVAFSYSVVIRQFRVSGFAFRVGLTLSLRLFVGFAFRVSRFGLGSLSHSVTPTLQWILVSY